LTFIAIYVIIITTNTKGVILMCKVNPIKDINKVRAVKDSMIADNKIRLAFLYILGNNTGFRVSDLLKIKYEDLRTKQEITLKEQKTKKDRTISLNSTVKEAFKLIDQGQTGFIFLSDSNRNKAKQAVWSRQYVSQELKHYATLAGIDQNVGTHTMRKTFGYFMYKKTNNLGLVQKLLNHTNIANTLKYIGIEQEELNNAVTALNIG
jgi:site-specific recombinase XerD